MPVHVFARLESSAFDAGAVFVHRVHGREAISRCFAFQIELVTQEDRPLVPSDLVGADLSLVFELDGEVVRTVRGFIAEIVDLLTVEAAFRAYRLVLVPRLQRLASIETQDVFLNRSVPDVVEAKLALVGIESGDIDARYKATYPKREIVVEYKETDLAFVSRLTEHLGVSFFFLEDDDQDRVAFTDHAAGFARLDAPVSFRSRGERTGVFALERVARAMPETFVVGDYNYRTPLVDLTGSATATLGNAGGVVEFGSNVATPDESAALAQVRAEERASEDQFYRGVSALPSFAAGYRFQLEDHPRLGGDEELLLVEVTHDLTQPVLLQGAGEQHPPRYENHFRAVSTKTTYRPRRVTPKPRIHGVLTALVQPPADAIVGPRADIDEMGRYTVRFNFDMSTDGRPKHTLPVRMLQAHAGTGYGAHFPLHPGVEVAIVFEDGDPDRPLIVGAVPNAVTPSPVTRANSNVSRLQTASGIRVTIRDHY